MYSDALAGDHSSLISTIASLCRPHALLCDLGFAACANPSRLKDILSQFATINETDVALMISMMIRTHSGTPDETKTPLVNALSRVVSQKWEPQNSHSHTDQNADGTPSTWNIDVFVSTLQDLVCTVTSPMIWDILFLTGIFISFLVYVGLKCIDNLTLLSLL